MTADDSVRYKRNVGLSIRLMRERRGLKQYELADRLGMARSTLTNIELGNGQIRVETVFVIARALNCEPSDLMPEARASKPWPTPPLPVKLTLSVGPNTVTFRHTF